LPCRVRQAFALRIRDVIRADLRRIPREQLPFAETGTAPSSFDALFEGQAAGRVLIAGQLESRFSDLPRATRDWCSLPDS
jgi:hypothetical protein